MTSLSTRSPLGRTASFAGSTNCALVDHSALGAHLEVCRHRSGTLFVVRRGAELIHGFLAGRFVTTLALIALIIGGSSLVL